MTILWLSDIHYKGKINASKNGIIYKEYDDKNYVINYLANFKKKINELINQIDIVLITGDIGFDGSIENYNGFKHEFDILFQKPIITIPGNHDIHWEATIDFYKRSHTCPK